MSIEGPAYITTFIGKRLDEFDKKKFTRKHIKIVHTCIIEWFELRHPYYLRKELYQTLYKKDCMGKQLLFLYAYKTHCILIKTSLWKFVFSFVSFVFVVFFFASTFYSHNECVFYSKRLFFLYLQSEIFFTCIICLH